MNCKWDVIGETGLRFFGKMSASISHEIKNVLAIINENAGLLEDLTLMADKGVALDPERLKTMAGMLSKQVQRADGIMKNMNRLAHSIDESVMSVDLGEILGLVLSLSGRFASRRGVTLSLKPSAVPVTITTNPFFMENLIWRCLDFAMDAAGKGKTVGLISEELENGARIRFTGLQGIAESMSNRFPGEREKALLSLLKAEIDADTEAGELVVVLPGNIIP